MTDPHPDRKYLTREQFREATKCGKKDRKLFASFIGCPPEQADQDDMEWFYRLFPIERLTWACGTLNNVYPDEALSEAKLEYLWQFYGEASITIDEDQSCTS
jgi:hypothetical protein